MPGGNGRGSIAAVLMRLLEAPDLTERQRAAITRVKDQEIRLARGGAAFQPDPAVRPVTSFGDAQGRLRLASAHTRAVSEWVGGYDLMDGASERTRLALGRVALDLDAWAHVIQTAGENTN